MALFCIGDLHGKFEQFAEVLQTLPLNAQIICVGDIGLGFPDSETPACLSEPDRVAQERSQTVFLMRGNHDNPAIWKQARFDWNAQLSNIRIPADVDRLKVGNIHVIMAGGGTSVDRSHPERVDGVNWWKDESVHHSATAQVQRLVDAYGSADLFLSHVGPAESQPQMEKDASTFKHYSKFDPTLQADVLGERELISKLAEISGARTTAFGHYHVSLESNHGEFRYRCCAELEAWQYEKRSLLPPLPKV